MADELNSDGFLIKTNEKEPTEETEDMQTEFNGLSAQDENNLLSEDPNDPEDEIPSAQVQKPKPWISDKREAKQPIVKPSTSSHQVNALGKKRHREDKSAKTETSNGAKIPPRRRA